MVFLEVRYKTYDRTGQPVATHRTFINMDCIRRIGRSENGWARIYWTTRVDPTTIDETYDSFMNRVRNEYAVVTLPNPDD